MLVDTLRFDRLGVYGYEKPTSPNIDALAARGTVFDRHVSPAAQTVPATLSLLLSQLPAEHGFVHRRSNQFAQAPPHFPERLRFLAEVLRDAGYRTGGFVGNPFLGRKNGFDQGFDRFVHAVSRDRELADAALRFLREDAPGPFFAYVHLFEVHSPYRAPERFRRALPGPSKGRLVHRNGPKPKLRPENLAYTEAAYDQGVLYADALVGELLRALEETGASGRTLVVLTSDHGEEFMEHGGLGHGTHVFGELVRIPLVLFDPRDPGGGRRIAHLSSALDLAPTLLDRVGVPRPESFRGGSVLAPTEAAFTEERNLRAVYAAGFKLIRNLATDRELFFASDDALDLRPLDSDDPVRASLAGRLDDYVAREADPATPPDEGDPDAAWTEAELEQLRALGYAR